MSSCIITINNEKHFVTIQICDAEVSFAMTNFKSAYREKIPKSDVFSRSKKLNQLVELEDQKVLEIISTPSETVEAVPSEDSTTLTVKFKYKVAGYSFKFDWNLERLNDTEFSKSLVLPAFDALSKLLRQIDLFKSIPDQDPASLGCMPKYSHFDLEFLLKDGQASRHLMEVCKEEVAVQEGVVAEMKRPAIVTPRRNRKRARIQKLIKQNSKVKQPLFRDSQSSQET